MHLHSRITESANSAPTLDPRALLLCAAGCAVGISMVTSLTAAALWCVLGLTALMLSLLTLPAGLPWQRVRGGLLSVNGFMLAVWCTLPLTLPWPEALELATLLTLKANAALLFLLALCAPLSLAQVASALHALGVSPALVTLFLLTCRHVHDLRQDFAISLQALRLRVPSPGFRRALYLYACLVCSVLVRANDKANALRMALACRHTEGEHSLSHILPSALHGRLHWTWKETSLCALSLLLCALTALNLTGDSLAEALAHF